MKMTHKLAMAAGQDAANRQMKSAGRKAWSEEDRDTATVTMNRLLLDVPFGEGGLQGLDLTADMLADLGLEEVAA